MTVKGLVIVLLILRFVYIEFKWPSTNLLSFLGTLYLYLYDREVNEFSEFKLKILYFLPFSFALFYLCTKKKA